MPSRIVLVHGLAGSRRWWRPLLPWLREYEVRFADPREALDVRQDDVLVGHSLGGMRAAQFAATEPVRKLVLIDPAGLPTGRWFAADMLATLGATTLRFYPTVTMDALRWGPRAILRYGWEATRTHLDVATITAPTLIVWGERDNLVPARLATEWHKAIRGSRLEVIPHARHVPMVEAPSAVAEVLLDFLRDDRGSGVVDGVRLAGDDREAPARE